MKSADEQKLLRITQAFTELFENVFEKHKTGIHTV
jgi:hypothetical protein